MRHTKPKRSLVSLPLDLHARLARVAKFYKSPLLEELENAVRNYLDGISEPTPVVKKPKAGRA